jgi:uncharacterized protein YwqG
MFNRIIAEKYKNETQKKCYRVKFDKEEYPELMDNKIGGCPYFPENENYPLDKDGHPMCLLLQVNLKDIELEGFPETGILEIFIPDKLDYPLETKIFIFEEGKPQKDLPEIDMSSFIIQCPTKINVEPCTSPMPLSIEKAEDVMREILYETKGEILEDGMLYEIMDEDLYRDINSNIPSCCIGGYPDFTQTDTWSSDENLEVCLFKLDSMVDDIVDIGDCGILNVFISKEGLKNKNFNEAIAEWDCC